MTVAPRLTRRRAVAIAAAGVLPSLHIRSAGAAGSLRVGLWKHWNSKANGVTQRQVEDWAKQNRVSVTLDFIPQRESRLEIVQAAEAEAGAGHDLLNFFNWQVQTYADQLEPMDDVVAAMTHRYGRYNPIHAYLARVGGHWMALPSSTGTWNLNCVGRISLLQRVAGINVRELYPAHPATAAQSAQWTYAAFQTAAQACARAGYAFGLGLAPCSDAINTAGALFAGFGAHLVNAAGQIRVDSDAVHAVLDYIRELAPFLPKDSLHYDDSSNNQALISGGSALIMNPPSAWSDARHSAPKIAADCWHFPWPAGPKGRFCPYNYCFLGAWRFGRNKAAAKELAQYLQERRQVQERDTVTNGYDLPPLPSMLDFPIWQMASPPEGTVYNYPLRPWHDAQQNIAAYPAPPAIAAQIYRRATQVNMLAGVYLGRSNEQVIAWARRELEGFMG